VDQERPDPGQAPDRGQDPDPPGRAGEAGPSWVRSAIRRLLLGAAALVAAFWLLGKLSDLVLLLVVSLFVAFAVEPAVNVLARRGWRRARRSRPGWR